MSNVNIDVNELINSLNAQIASLNLELTIAKLQLANLQKNSDEFGQSTQGGNDDDFGTPVVGNKIK